MYERIFKGGIAALSTITAFFIGNFTPLVYMLIFFEIGDYITGIYVAFKEQSLSSKAAIDGFFKKLFYFFLVAAAFGFDYMILEISRVLGMTFEYPAVFGIMSICYLLSTELLSIVENLEGIGIVVPFLTKALECFREKIKKAPASSDISKL